MKNYKSSFSKVVICLTIFLGVNATAQMPGMEEINKQPDNVGTGAFPAMKEEVSSLPDHVVYRPKDLNSMGDLKLGVVAWGNGGCSTDGASTRFHLLELASHGYLVIANGKILSGPGAPPREASPQGQGQQDMASQPRTNAEDLVAAVDWALNENKRKDSPYYNRIAADQIAFSGFSCGGIEALRVAGDPRVKTLVLHNTGIFNTAPNVNLPSMNIGKDALQKIHTPTIYILGGESDIAYANGMDDYQRLEHVPAAVANLSVGHGGTYFQPDGGSAAQVAVNWLQWTLRGDAQAKKYFVGSECGLCSDKEWTYESKRLDAVKP